MEPRSASENLPLFGAGGVGERSLDVAEELRFQQRLGNGRTVDLDERHVALRAAMVHGAGDQLLARAGFAGDQHRAARRRHQLDAMDHIGDRAAVADDAVPREVVRPAMPGTIRYDCV